VDSSRPTRRGDARFCMGTRPSWSDRRVLDSCSRSRCRTYMTVGADPFSLPFRLASLSVSAVGGGGGGGGGGASNNERSGTGAVVASTRYVSSGQVLSLFIGGSSGNGGPGAIGDGDFSTNAGAGAGGVGSGPGAGGTSNGDASGSGGGYGGGGSGKN
jgi:hypothetical protein